MIKFTDRGEVVLSVDSHPLADGEDAERIDLSGSATVHFCCARYGYWDFGR